MFVDSILTTTDLIVFNKFSAAKWQIMYLSAAISRGGGEGSTPGMLCGSLAFLQILSAGWGTKLPLHFHSRIAGKNPLGFGMHLL